MTMKFNGCYESYFSDEVLTKCQKATCLAVKDAQKPAADDDNIEGEELEDEQLNLASH